MNLIQQLRRDKRFSGVCPSCGEEFPLHKAILFYAREPMPAEALKRLQKMRALLKERKDELKEARKRATEKAEITTESVNIGKIVEKIAPSFRSFGFSPRDCRALLEPIDYLVFPGLAARSEAEAILFVDVKSGGARLNRNQKVIQNVVESGKVELRRIARVRRS
jgi:predicted Holliday junction resolvase-like endonuclease